MANPLKQLAGQTVIYGLSTILARIINFLFVPIYTRLLTPESYGVVTEFMAYIAVLQVVLVLGLETGCFRFANKEGVDPKKVYSSAFVTVFCVSATFLALMIAFASPIASIAILAPLFVASPTAKTFSSDVAKVAAFPETVPFFVFSIESTTPSISEIVALPFGLRASNNSSTRGRP